MNNIYAIFASLSANAPLLKNWGMGLSRSLFLTTLDVQGISEITEKLSEHPLLIDPSTRIRQLKDKMEITNSEAVVVVMPHQKLRDCKKFQLLVETVLNWNLHTKCRCQIFFIGSIVPDDMHDFVYEIPISEFQDGTDFDVDVVPEPLDLSAVQEQICRFPECDHDRLALYAAVACMYPWFKEHGELSEYQKMLDLADEVFFSVTEDQDLSSIVNQIKRLITKAVVSEAYSIVSDGDTVDCINKTFIFDEYSDGFWMSYKTFRGIIEPVRAVCKKSEIQRALTCTDIINNSESGNIIKRKTIHTAEGATREHMVQINARKIIIPDPEVHLTLADYIRNKISGGEKCQI